MSLFLKDRVLFLIFNFYFRLFELFFNFYTCRNVRKGIKYLSFRKPAYSKFIIKVWRLSNWRKHLYNFMCYCSLLTQFVFGNSYFQMLTTFFHSCCRWSHVKQEQVWSISLCLAQSSLWCHAECLLIKSPMDFLSPNLQLCNIWKRLSHHDSFISKLFGFLYSKIQWNIYSLLMVLLLN